VIRVVTDGPKDDDDFYKVIDARERLIKKWKDTGGTRPRTTQIYRQLRPFLVSVFKEKCGYCETKRSGGPKSIDHFRPTNQVTADREVMAHTGYWWLVYEWYNLLPACEECNEWYCKIVRGEKEMRGKASEFPTSGQRVASPSDEASNWRAELKAEQPLLICPYDDYPEEHIKFDRVTFYPQGLTDRGEVTIKVCGLDRDDLFSARCEALERLKKILIGELNEGTFTTTKVDDSEQHSAFLNTWLSYLRESARD
jgi:hypothetical protein